MKKQQRFGTKKVIEEHSTIGIVMTTDGSVTDLDRASYVEAEERVISEMKACGKPFVVVLNCKNPNNADSKKLVQSLSEKYAVQVMAMNVAEMKDADVDKIFEKVLMEFPIKSIKVNMPKWLSTFFFKSNHKRNCKRNQKVCSRCKKNWRCKQGSGCFYCQRKF